MWYQKKLLLVFCHDYLLLFTIGTGVLVDIFAFGQFDKIDFSSKQKTQVINTLLAFAVVCLVNGFQCLVDCYGFNE